MLSHCLNVHVSTLSSCVLGSTASPHRSHLPDTAWMPSTPVVGWAAACVRTTRGWRCQKVAEGGERSGERAGGRTPRWRAQTKKRCVLQRLPRPSRLGHTRTSLPMPSAILSRPEPRDQPRLKLSSAAALVDAALRALHAPPAHSLRQPGQRASGW